MMKPNYEIYPDVIFGLYTELNHKGWNFIKLLLEDFADWILCERSKCLIWRRLCKFNASNLICPVRKSFISERKHMRQKRKISTLKVTNQWSYTCRQQMLEKSIFHRSRSCISQFHAHQTLRSGLSWKLGLFSEYYFQE